MKIKEGFIVSGIVVLIVAFVGLATYTHYLNRQIVSEQPAGTVISATYDAGGLFTPETTTIETDQGVYLVGGIFQITKGNLLTIQIKKNNDRILLDNETKIQKPLLR